MTLKQGLNLYSNKGTPGGVVDSLNDETSAHELFHTMGLYHTFANQNRFTLNQYLSDNILDYSILASTEIQANAISGISSMRIQWKQIRRHDTIRNEI